MDVDTAIQGVNQMIRRPGQVSAFPNPNGHLAVRKLEMYIGAQQGACKLWEEKYDRKASVPVTRIADMGRSPRTLGQPEDSYWPVPVLRRDAVAGPEAIF